MIHNGLGESLKDNVMTQELSCAMLSLMPNYVIKRRKLW